MAVTIGSNINSLKAQRQLNQSSSALSKTFERLGSGLRINRASDDAAGLAISSILNSSSRVYGQAIRNVNDGISALGIADGAAGELSNIVTRLKELATQGANGTFSLRQRLALNVEARQLREEYNRIIETTTFNGIKLLADQTGSIGIATGTSGLNGILQLNSSNLKTGNRTTGTYANPVQLEQAGIVRNQVSIDLNTDGKLDIVYGDLNVGGLSVLYGNGDGTFQQAKTVQGTESWGVNDITLADMNGDGQEDLVTAGSGTGVVRVGVGGANTLTFQEYAVPIIGAGTAVAVGDLNRDGIQDVIVGGLSGNVVGFLGKADGTFQTSASDWFQSNGLGYDVTDVAVGDLNGDGKLDIVATDSYVNQAQIAYGNGAGLFGSGSHTYFDYVGSLSGTGKGVVLGDYNGDSRLDIAISTNAGHIEVALNNGIFGDFSSTPHTTYDDVAPSRMRATDLNDDGITDFVGGSGFILGNGDGTFGSANFYTVYADGSVGVGDFNGDGVIDLTLTYSWSSTMEYLQANSTVSSGLNTLSVSTRSQSLAALDMLDRAQSALGQARGRMGAEQSRLAASLSTIATTRDNFEQASSRISNADIGADSAELVRQGLIQQAASAILAQANQEPALALRLLGS